MHQREIEALSANLLEAMRFFGRAQKTGELQECPGVTIISCGLNYAAFNAAIVSSPLHGGPPGELLRRLQKPGEHFESRNLRWTCWYCDDFLDSKSRKETVASLRGVGLHPLTNNPGLYADRLLPPTRELVALDVRRVDNEQTRLAFAHITSIAFDIPGSICRQIYGAERAWSGSFQGFVGYSAGMPVTTTATVVTGDVVGVYSVGTLPKYRRRGFAEAIMRQALAHTREQTGIETTVLQSSSSGLSLYRQMGYRQLTRFSVFIS